MFQEANLTDLPKFRCAHATNAEGGTGCTAFIAPEGAVAGVDVRGGAPATRETDLLKPENMVQQIHCVVLSGGSAFGLEAACGVMEELAARDMGFKLAGACVPIVCGASLFDLPVGQPAWPGKPEGGAVAKAALEHAGQDLECGCVGAGTGATVGKMGLPTQAMKSGFGWVGLRQGDLVVIANVAVNALGNVMAEDGSWLAGTLGEDGRVEDPFAAATKAAMVAAQAQGAQASPEQEGDPVSNTTLGCILTNAKLDKAQATKVAQISQDAYARCIKPAHTTNDGDTIFVMASGEVEAATDVVGVLATEAMERAIRKAVRSAKGAYGLPAEADIRQDAGSGVK
ncbi:MAG: P1 family peptidase [Eggerthellaceae bacterium]|nr:P1 family peptidase [Eggerthellaceae bacterium]